MMIAALKAETRKLLTLRSTYVILLLTLLAIALLAGYALGYRVSPETAASPEYLRGTAMQSLSAVGILIPLAGVLLFTHEYRYNTILYSFGANRRSTVLAAKLLVTLGWSMLTTTLILVLAPLATMAGAGLGDTQLAAQHFAYADTAWRGLAYGVGFSLFGVLFASLIRNQVGTIVAFLIAPGTIESLLSLLLKDNTKYLPFTALQQIIVDTGLDMKPAAALVVAAVWLIGGWAIAYVLFLRHDAN